MLPRFEPVAKEARKWLLIGPARCSRTLVRDLLWCLRFHLFSVLSLAPSPSVTCCPSATAGESEPVQSRGALVQLSGHAIPYGTRIAFSDYDVFFAVQALSLIAVRIAKQMDIVLVHPHCSDQERSHIHLIFLGCRFPLETFCLLLNALEPEEWLVIDRAQCSFSTHRCVEHPSFVAHQDCPEPMLCQHPDARHLVVETLTDILRVSVLRDAVLAYLHPAFHACCGKQ